MKANITGCYLKKSLDFPDQNAKLTQQISADRLTVFSDRPFVKKKHYLVLISNAIFGTYTNDYSFSTYKDDPEQLVIDLYEAYGNQFCSLLEGNFLICIYDTKNDTLLFFNNRYQATSLYYYVTDDIFIFADTLKSLLQWSPIETVFSPNSLPSFLNTGFSCSEKTQLNNVYRLLPTYSIKINQQEFLLDNHWHKEFTFNRRPFKNLEPMLDTYESLFQKSIQNFLTAAKPTKLGCFLSGGHDTAFTFIQASKLFSQPIHAFTASFANFGFDEAPKAKYVTNQFNGVHHVVQIGPKELDFIPEMIRVTEEPVAGSSLGIYMCAKEAANYTDAILTGDSGDSLWGEYYPVAEWQRYFKHIPTPLRKMIYFLNKHMAKIVNWERLWESSHVFSLFTQNDIYDNFFERLCTYRHFNHQALKNILNPTMFPKIEYQQCHLDIPCTKDNFYDYLVESKMFYGVYQYMIPPTQKSLEAMHLEFFTPYFNHELIDFINTLPKDWLNAGSTFKKLINDAERRKFHKQALLRYFPKRFVYSMQQSMDIPFHALFRGRSQILEALLVRLKKRGWYNNDTLTTLFNEFPKQKVKPHEICELNHHGYRIYSLLTFEVWCMEFLDKRPNPTKESNTPPIPLEKYLAIP